jgi:hypothetical protein
LGTEVCHRYPGVFKQIIGRRLTTKKATTESAEFWGTIEFGHYSRLYTNECAL